MKFFLLLLTLAAYVTCQSEDDQELRHIASIAIDSIKNIKSASEVDDVFAPNVALLECGEIGRIEDIKRYYEQRQPEYLSKSIRIRDVKKLDQNILVNYVEILVLPDDVVLAAMGILVLEPSDDENQGYRVKVATQECYENAFDLLDSLNTHQKPQLPKRADRERRMATAQSHRAKSKGYIPYWVSI